MSSVCLSVCNVGGLWSHRLEFFEIIIQLVSLGCSLSADSNIRGLLQVEHPDILAQSDPPPVDLSAGDIRSQIAAEWLHIAQRSQWGAYRKPPSLFRMVPSLTPIRPPLTPKMWVPYAPKIRKWHISPQRVIRYTSYLVLWWVFRDGESNSVISGSNKSKMASAAMLEKFQMAISPQPVVRSTSSLVLGWGFRGRRIQWRYFRFEQIQDGGHSMHFR